MTNSLNPVVFKRFFQALNDWGQPHTTTYTESTDLFFASCGEGKAPSNRRAALGQWQLKFRQPFDGHDVWFSSMFISNALRNVCSPWQKPGPFWNTKAKMSSLAPQDGHKNRFEIAADENVQDKKREYARKATQRRVGHLGQCLKDSARGGSKGVVTKSWDVILLLKANHGETKTFEVIHLDTWKDIREWSFFEKNLCWELVETFRSTSRKAPPVEEHLDKFEAMAGDEQTKKHVLYGKLCRNAEIL